MPCHYDTFFYCFPDTSTLAWFPLNHREIKRGTATVRDCLRWFTNWMETCSHNDYDSRQSLAISIWRVEMSSTFSIITTVPINEKLHGNTDGRRYLVFKWNHVSLGVFWFQDLHHGRWIVDSCQLTAFGNFLPFGNVTAKPR